MIAITVVRTVAYPEFGLPLHVVGWGEYDEKPSIRPTGYYLLPRWGGGGGSAHNLKCNPIFL